MIDLKGSLKNVLHLNCTLYSPGVYRVQLCLGVFFLSLALLLPDSGAQQPVTAPVHLENGLIRTVKIHSANESGIMWSDRTSPNPQLMPHEQIAVVDFPAPELWEQGINYFNRGEFPKAVAAFSSLTNDPRNQFHPAPGNYTSLALLRLIDCYRETGDAASLVSTAARLDPKSLPDYERGAMEVISAWAEIGKGNYAAALAKAESITPNPISPDRNDLAFIKALSLEKTGKPEEAIIAYGTAYTVDFGGSRELAKRAIQNAFLLLVNLGKESRDGELHSLVHAYAKVYNQGKLWEGAPARAVELLETKLEIATKPPQTETKAAPAPEGAEDTGTKPPGKITITSAGKQDGYHIIGNGNATNEATAFRSPDVKKSFDVDGDNVYGTKGVLIFGDGGKPGNGQKFSRHTQVGAAWASFSAGLNFSSVAITTTQGPLDNPKLPPEASVADWPNTGFAFAHPKGRTKNPWLEILHFTMSKESPQKFRVGIISGTHSMPEGRWDPEAIRIAADSGTPSATISKLPNNKKGHPNWIFFDVDLNGKTSGKFTISGRLRRGGKGVGLTGVTFDVPTPKN